MSGYKNIDPKGGNKFSSTNQPQKNGRKPSIRKQLQELLDNDGEVIVSAKDVIKINDNGDVVIKIPTEMKLAMKLFKMATKGNNHTTLKAMQMIMEQIDGKPKQSMDIQSSDNSEKQIVIFQLPDNGRNKIENQ